MDRTTYWKNFKMLKELDISGRFIYNGLLSFHQMEHFAYEEEIFEFFYNVSVGIERLLKICVILTEHTDDKNQQEFTESLKTHNHRQLLDRVKNNHKIGVSNVHNDFIEIIAEFYKLHRYGRYNVETITTKDKEKVQLHDFIEKHHGVKIDDKTPFEFTRNNEAIKKFIGKTVGKIAEELYKVVRAEADRLGIYTDEIRHNTKAYKIFMCKTYNFFDEDILCKELLIFFINSTTDTGQIGLMKSIKPLEFDPASANEYIECLGSNVKSQEVMDECEHLYQELGDELDNDSERKKLFLERKETISAVGNHNIHFRDEEDEDEDDEL